MLRAKKVWLISAGCYLCLLGCGNRAPALEATLAPLPTELPPPTASSTPTLFISPTPSSVPTFPASPTPDVIVSPLPYPPPILSAVPATPVATLTPTEPSPSAVPKVQPTNVPPLPSEDERHLAELVNQERLRAGLTTVSMDGTLLEVARARSSDMLTRNYFSHTDPVTQQPLAFSLLQQHGLNIAYGENLFKGGPYQLQITDQAMQLFMADEPHRNIILTPAWNATGVGVAIDNSTVIITQIFGLK